MDQSSLLTIGQFSRLALLSQKALRLYDQLGVLKPAHIDPLSGYRYYEVEQVREARLVRTMRQMDIPLATIQRVLKATPAEAEALLHAHVRAMEQHVAYVRHATQDVVASLHNEEHDTLRVGVRTLAPQHVVSTLIRVQIQELKQRVRHHLDTLTSFIAEHNELPVGTPFGFYHGHVNDEDDGPIEVCVPVQRRIIGRDHITAKEIPGGHLAYVVLRGDDCTFPAVLRGYDTVFDWLHQHGYRLEESPREIWHRWPTEHDAELEVARRFDPHAAS